MSQDQRRGDRERFVLNHCPFIIPVPSRSVLGMPDTVEEMCPDIPQLEGLMNAAYSNKEAVIRDLVQDMVSTYHPEKGAQPQKHPAEAAVS